MTEDALVFKDDVGEPKPICEGWRFCSSLIVLAVTGVAIDVYRSILISLAPNSGKFAVC